MPLNVRDMLPERPIPDLPAPAHGLEESLTAAVPGPGLESRIDMNDHELNGDSHRASSFRPI